MCGDCKNGHGKSKPCYRPGCNQPSSRRRRAIDSYHQESFQNFLNNINDDVDVSFPVQGNKYLTHHGGIQPYVSVVESTGSVYFTVKKTPSTAHVIVNAAVESIPLLLFILLLSILAGMIIWILVSTFIYLFLIFINQIIKCLCCTSSICLLMFLVRSVLQILTVFHCRSWKE